MELEFSSGKMAQSLKANLEIICLMEKEEKSMQMANSTLDNLKTIKLMDMECFKISMEENTKDNGQTINSMEQAKRFGIMDQKTMKEILQQVKSMERVDLSGTMAHTMKEILKKEFFMVQVFTISKNSIRLTMDNLSEEKQRETVK